MLRVVSSLLALLISAGVLLTGNGLQNTLVPIRASIEGYPLPLIGLLTSAYFVGFIAGCLKTPTLVARAGHIRSFCALAALAAAATLVLALTQSEAVWISVRMLTGFCFAGLYMIIESWINEKSTNDIRGKVLAVYRIVDLTFLTIGQYLLLLASPAGFVLFSTAAILVCLSIVPVATTKAIQPDPIARTRLDLKRLWRVSPLALMGSAGVGLANGAFWAMAPIYVQDLGFDLAMVATFISVAIVCGALAQWPIGHLSDLLDRRVVLVWTAAAAGAAAIWLSRTSAGSPGALLFSVGLYGVFAMPIFGLSAANANDNAEGNDFVAISGGLLLVYGLGSIAGPFVASSLMAQYGPSALFAFAGVVYGALFLFGLVRLLTTKGVPEDEQGDYVAVPRTSPGVFEIDPRSVSDDEEAVPAERSAAGMAQS